MKTIWMMTLTLLLPALCWSQQVEINGVYPDEIQSRGFTLTQDASVKVSGTAGVFTDEWRKLLFYGWIIDSDSREVVWHLFDEKRSDRRRDGEREGLYEFDYEVDLKKGSYELYFSGANGNAESWSNGITVSSVGDVIDAVFDSRRREKYRRSDADDMSIAVKANGLQRANVDELIEAKLSNAVIAFNRVRSGKDFEKGFTLTAETKLDIYALGEGQRDETFDRAWIQNAATRERVFDMNYRNTEFAGGASKNLSVRETITLPAGSYQLFYVTDDSHAYDDWNAMPPDDPEFWGVTLWPATTADAGNVTDFVAPAIAKPLVDLTQVRDDKLVSQGLTVKKDMEVSILCLGEASGNDKLVDYGWIVNAATREKVWEMDDWDAEHAGGASKNRVQQDKIKLPAGDYLVYYVTDDSHAYRDWNASKPNDADMWGISIWAVNESDLKQVTTFDADDYKNPNVIAEITRVGNGEYLKKTFELTQDTQVRVIALGEGDNNEMYDYGYIKNTDTGETVWKMRYRNSDYAGGARKNRECNELITLEKGNYRLVYESDDSHSYNRWNSGAPRDPERWGITVVKK